MGQVKLPKKMEKESSTEKFRPLVYLTESEVERAKKMFAEFDLDDSGTIDIWELRNALQCLGKKIADDDLMTYLKEVDEDGTGDIDFEEFLRMLELHKFQLIGSYDEDTVASFVALGGNPDKTGKIDACRLQKVCKDLGLSIDINSLVRAIDTDGSGFVDFDEFSTLLNAGEADQEDQITIVDEEEEV